MPSSQTFDLAVIGGGPAGTSAAITAARGSASVLLLERGKLPRQRVCGEFVSAESLELLKELGKDSGVLDHALRIPEARLFFDGHDISAPVDPPAASIARLDLDLALWNAAQGAGVTTKLQTSVEKIAGTGPFSLFTSDATYASQAIIDASGRWSKLRDHSAPDSGTNHVKWLGVKAHFAEPDPHRSVDLYFFDGGYCGVQPVTLSGSNLEEGRVNTCAMVRSDAARNLQDVFSLHPALKERAENWKPLGDPVTTSPLLFHAPEPVQDRILRVGDSAGFVDPFVGDGISLALQSGALAAHAVLPFLRGKSSLDQAVEEYFQQYNDRLLPIFRNSSRIRRLLNLPHPVRRSVGHLLELSPTVSRLLVQWTR
jgi:flavin-dependent dehydrogenase